MKTFLIGALIIIVGAVGYYLWLPQQGDTNIPDEIPSSTSVRIEAGIGQGASGLGVGVAPEEVLEDSRCPIDVQCVWAGTVRVRTLLSSGLGEAAQIFELGKPITTEAEEITLVDVLPYPEEGEKPSSGDYRFIFEISKRSVQ